MDKEAKKVLEYSKKILSGKENHSFSKYLGKNFSERSIETPWVASTINKYNIKSILDIGFTMSSLDYLGLLLELNKKYGVQIEAVDIVKPERVRTRYPKEWLDEIFSISITVGDMRKINVQEGKYDAVTCISTIEHIGFDKATIGNLKTAFDRKLKPKEVNIYRPSDINQMVLNKFYRTMKRSGKLLISVPMGKGGAIVLQDSLGYYTAEWEYNENSWNEIILHPKFKLIEQHFFKFTDTGFWEQVDNTNDLSNRSSSLQKFALGCAIALLKKI